MPAARSLWNGTITFGSVAIPVKLYSATASRTLRFREVRAKDGATVEHRRIGEESGDEIDYADVEKAYDEGGKRVVLTPEELAAADGPRPKVVAIEHFVRAEEIDPVFYDKPYLVGAREDGAHGYRVLLAALEEADKVGIGRFVLRSRENLVAIRPLGGVLGLQTMRFDDELVEKRDLELPSLRRKPGERETAMAGKLVEMLEGDWDPSEHEDTYRAAVMDLIDRKAAGRKPKRVRRRPEEGGDLAAALEASLAGGKKAGASKASGAKKTSGTKTAASGSKKTSGTKKATGSKTSASGSKKTSGTKKTSASGSKKTSGSKKAASGSKKASGTKAAAGKQGS